MIETKERDIQMMVAAKCHIGSKNCNYQMERYIHSRNGEGNFVFNLQKTWEKLQIAAKIIVAIENPQDIVVLSARPYGQRAVLKFAQYTGCKVLPGRHTPGTFTNQLQKLYEEPRLLIVTDPLTDHQPLLEASYVNIPTIALCGSESPLKNVDIAIPTNNSGKYPIGVMYYLLAQTVLHMRGTLPYEQPWDVSVDLFFYKDLQDTEKQQEAAAENYVYDAPAFDGGFATEAPAEQNDPNFGGFGPAGFDPAAPVQPSGAVAEQQGGFDMAQPPAAEAGQFGQQYQPPPTGADFGGQFS